MRVAMLFERLVEPYLVLDSAHAPLLANAAWRARFGGPGANRDGDHDARPDLATLDAEHRGWIAALIDGLREGETRVSDARPLRTQRLSPALHARPSDTATLADVLNPAPAEWRLNAAYLPATATEPALLTLRYDDVPARPRDLEQPFEQALELAGFGVWAIDAGSGRIRCNAQGLRDLDVARGEDLTRQMLLGGSPAEAAANWQALTEHRPFEFELNLSAAHAPRWVLVRGAAQFDEHGAMRAVIGATIDITSRKNHELDLHTLATTERFGRERSEAVTRTMDKFIASVSHELRSPLNAIVSWAEVLQLAANPAHVARAGEAIRRNGRQLSHMVDDLLDSGALATGKLSVKLQPVDFGALAAIVAEDVSKLAQQKNLRLDASNVSACIVMADESRLKQVVWNLLTNAVKFTDAGEIDVSVNTIGDQVRLTVRDTGRGIDADALPVVFERFQQIAPEASGRVGGLGLGLWLAKHIVTLHAGTIDVASDGYGKGAVFTVSLPLAFPSLG